MAIRSMGSATIAFGLVSVPVKIYSTVDTTQGIKFSYMSPNGEKLKQQYVDPQGEVVEFEDRKRGYEYAKGQYAIFSPEEIKALDAESTNAIDIQEFVAGDQVGRFLIDKTYYLGPDSKGPSRAFHLLRAALAKTGKVAVARYAVKGTEHLVAVRTMGEGLVMEQLKLHEKVRPQEGVPLNPVEISDKEIDLAVMLIENQSSEEFDHSQYRDEVRERVFAMVQEKVDSGAISTADKPKAEAPKAKSDIDSLMAALEASIGKAA